MKKILITGSNGLLGQKLIHLLSEEKDIEFLATARGENRINSIKVPFRSMDITSEQEVNDVIMDYRPDHIIHTAAMTNVDTCEQNPDDCHLLNVKAVEYLVNAANKVEAHFIHLSTDFIFDGEEGPYAEEDKPNPISIYGESKLESEQIVMQRSARWAIARTVLVYGIAEGMSRSNIILWARESLQNKKDIKVVTDQWRTPTLAEDLAMGCFLIAKHNAEGIYNISGEEMLNPYQMAQKTAEYFNLSTETMTEADSSTFTQPAKRPPKTGFIIKKAKDLLGYKPHTFDEGIEILDRQLKSM